MANANIFDLATQFLQGAQLGEQMRTQRIARDMAQQQYEKQILQQAELTNVLRTGDDAAIIDFVRKYPGLKNQVEQSMAFVNDLTKQRAIGAYSKAGRLIKAGDTDSAVETLKDHAQYVREQGGNPSDTVATIRQIMGGDKTALGSINLGVAAMIGPEEYLKLQQKQQELQDVITTDTGYVGRRGEQAIFVPFGPDVKTREQAEREEKQRLQAIEKRVQDEKTRFDRANTLRDEYSRDAQNFNLIGQSYERVRASVQDPSPAGDVALIYNFMKMLDPGSTVMEGEQATARSAGSVPDKMWNLYNRVITGEKLSATQRSDFLTRSRKLYGAAKKSNTKVEKRFKNLATRFGLDPDDIFGGNGQQATDDDRPPPGETPTTAPTPTGTQKIGRFTVKVRGQ